MGVIRSQGMKWYVKEQKFTKETEKFDISLTRLCDVPLSRGRAAEREVMGHRIAMRVDVGSKHFNLSVKCRSRPGSDDLTDGLPKRS